MSKRQNLIQNKFNFLKSHIRRKGLSKSSRCKSPQREVKAIAASAHDISQGLMDPDSMQISIHSGTTPQSSIASTASTSVVSQLLPVNQRDMDQFAQMKNMLTSFIWPRQETIRTAFCNYLASETFRLF